MHQFTAIPVTQGDAFYLKRGDWSVLVDGGRNESAFPGLFTLYGDPKGVDTLVCIHNDADHANGILGFLNAGLNCKEVWLPGRWLDVLPEVLKPMSSIVNRLAKDVLNDGPWKSIRLENYADHAPDLKVEGSIEKLTIGEQGWPLQLIDLLSGDSEHEGETEVRLSGTPYIFPTGKKFYEYMYPNGDERYEFLMSAIEAAVRIREIAKVSFHRGIKVRWFEFDAKKPGGGEPNLRPVNSRGITGARTSGGKSLLMFLSLSKVNKESLAFWSPEANGAAGVLFTADTDLSGVTLSMNLRQALVTSAHHGSEANSNLYSAVEGRCDDPSTVTWIRSDGAYKKRPGSSYLKVKGKRYCTICRESTATFSPKTVIAFNCLAPDWVSSDKKCTCT